MTSSRTAPVTGDMPSVYEGRQVNLRPVGREDARTMYQWRADLEAFHLLFVPEGVTTYEEFADQWELTLRRTITLLTVSPEDGRPSGLVQAYDINLADGWCYVASYVAPEYRSQRIGLEATVGFWDYLFTQVNMRKIYMDVAESNAGWLNAIPGLESGLFHEEGRFRQHASYDGQYLDTIRFALYRDSWLPLRSYVLPLFRLGAEPGALRAPQPAPHIGRASEPPRAGGASRRIDQVRRYLRGAREGAFDDISSIVADDVVFTTPLTGDVIGRQDLDNLLRFRHRMLSRAMEAGAAQQRIVWLEPGERDDRVTLRGSGPSGQIDLEWVFNDEDRMASISIAGPPELMTAYLLSPDLPIE